jgi:hypothetical protein
VIIYNLALGTNTRYKRRLLLGEWRLKMSKTMKDVKNSILDKYEQKVNRERVEDTHTRATFLFRNDLSEKLNDLSKDKRGFKTLFINQAIELLLDNLNMFENNESIPMKSPNGKDHFYENELEDILIKYINKIEDGMEFIARQHRVNGSAIDILARDKNNKLCVIELKVVSNAKDLIWQTAYYPTLFEEDIRMIVIAPDYSAKVYNALTSIKNVELKTYDFYGDESTIEVVNYN